MLTRWAKRYSQAAANSRLSSQLGALVILVIALIEAYYFFQRVSTAEKPSWELVYSSALHIFIFVVTFGLRFILFIRSFGSMLVRVITWWLIVVWVYVSVELYGPEPGVVYSLFHSFPLEVSGSCFIFVGTFRFLYFGHVAFKNDFNPNS